MLRNYVMFGLAIALGAINLMLAGCGGGMYLGDSASVVDDDSCPGASDYYEWGVEDGQTCYDSGANVSLSALDICADDSCIDCLVDAYYAGLESEGC